MIHLISKPSKEWTLQESKDVAKYIGNIPMGEKLSKKDKILIEMFREYVLNLSPERPLT